MLRPCAAFTLMEVNVALALVAIGLLGLLSLCSVGLRQSKQATSDTSQAAFVNSVFNGLHANAISSAMTNYNVSWANSNQFLYGSGGTPGSPHQGGILYNVAMPPDANSPLQILCGGPGQTNTINNFPVGGRTIVYTLSINPVAGPTWYRATMQVSDNPYMDLSKSPDIFVTDFIYMGM